MLTPVGSAAAATPATVVKASAMNGWAIVDDNGHAGGSGSFVTGPATPPVGNGSARLEVSAADAGWTFSGAANLAGTPLSAITTLTYDTYRSSVDVNNNLAIALSINVDYDTTDDFFERSAHAWQGRLVYEPYNNAAGTVPQNTWQHWDTTHDTFPGKWWQSGTPILGGVAGPILTARSLHRARGIRSLRPTRPQRSTQPWAD